MRLVIKTLVGLALLATAGACYGSSDGTHAPPVAPEPKKATLIVDVRGLPAGLDGDVTLQGTAFARLFPHSDTLAGLTPGTYSLITQSVENTNARYASGTSTQQVTLLPGETRSLAIDYAEITGRLAIAIDGVTADVEATIDVSGPAGFATHLSRSDTLRKLAPGPYTVAAAPTPGSSHFAPDTTSRTVRVDSARIASVIVRFQPFVSLAVQIDGLPQGVDASVDVVGPSFNTHLTKSAVISELPIGTYAVTPSAVAVGTEVYQATSQSVTLTFARPNTVVIHYVRQLARISFQIQGGPSSLGNPNSPIVNVSGPVSFSLSADTTISALPFGTYRYTVTAPIYDVHGTVYLSTRGAVYASTLAGRTDLSVTLDSLHTSESVVVPLTFVSGAVTFSAPGARTFPGTTVGVTLTDSRGSFVGIASNGLFILNLPPGTYTATPGLQTYRDEWDWPGVLSATTTVNSAFPISAIVIPYHPLSWPTISFNYSGMPSGLRVGFLLSMSSGITSSRSIVFAPATMQHGDLSLPGSYHVTFAGPTVAPDSSAAWTMSPKVIDFTAQEGQTSTITIPMVATNILKIAVTGASPFSPTSALQKGNMSVTFPDGHTTDFADFSSANGTIMISDGAVGNYVIKANPITLNGTTYVPNFASQTVSLPATGRIDVGIAYTVR